MNHSALRRRLAELVEAACDGEVSAEEAAEAESLVLVGMGSLAGLRLIDAVEREFGVVLHLDDDPALLDSVDALATYLDKQGVVGAREGGEAVR